MRVTMFAFLFIGILLDLPAIVSAEARTVGELKHCLKRNIAELTISCTEILPGKASEFQKCFAAGSRHGYDDFFAGCLKDGGVSDDDSCWTPDNWTGRGPKLDTAELAMFNTLPRLTQRMLDPFVDCAHLFLADKAGCYAGCNNQAGKTRNVFEACSGQDMEQLDQNNPLANCVAKLLFP